MVPNESNEKEIEKERASVGAKERERKRMNEQTNKCGVQIKTIDNNDDIRMNE